VAGSAGLDVDRAACPHPARLTASPLLAWMRCQRCLIFSGRL
jgi:hypothetical protein